MNNENPFDLSQQQPQQQHNIESSKSTQTRYAKNIQKRSTTPSNRELVNAASLNAFLENQGPKKVSLNVPQYQLTMQSNSNRAVSNGNIRSQNMPAGRAPSSSYGQTMIDTSRVPVNRVKVDQNTVVNRNAMRTDKSMQLAKDLKESAQKTSTEDSNQIQNWNDDEETFHISDESKTATPEEIVKHEPRPALYADQKPQTIPKTMPQGILHNTDFAFDNIEDIDVDTNEENDNDQHFKKFIRRVSPCEQKLLFETEKISNYPSTTYYHQFNSELSNKFKNWEEDILKELRNRFYSCCEECKKKVLENCRCSSSIPTVPVLPTPGQPRPPTPGQPRPSTPGQPRLLPLTISADGNEAQLAQQLQLLVDSLSPEQRRRLAQFYNRMPKRADRVTTS